MIKILIVDENVSDNIILEEYFLKSKYIFEQTKSIEQAILKIKLYEYNLVIIACNIDNNTTTQIIKQTKQIRKETGIIVIAKKHDVNFIIQKLNDGADDCLTCPFNIDELHARIIAVARRLTFKSEELLLFDEFSINPMQQQLYFKNEKIKLTKTEYHLLMYFLTNKNKTISKIHIAEYIWGDHYSDDDNFDIIYVHLKNLRKKLMNANGKNYINTVYGMGYKFSN